MSKDSIRKLIIRFLISLVATTICFGQMQVGDTIPEWMGLEICSNYELEGDSLYLHDFNGATNELGQHYIIWITIVTSW
tara:strand:+ start:1002 stop:1238 length:237 start_codon:yes stop_codon:yes gene_type:complete